MMITTPSGNKLLPLLKMEPEDDPALAGTGIPDELASAAPMDCDSVNELPLGAVASERAGEKAVEDAISLCSRAVAARVLDSETETDEGLGVDDAIDDDDRLTVLGADFARELDCSTVSDEIWEEEFSTEDDVKGKMTVLVVGEGTAATGVEDSSGEGEEVGSTATDLVEVSATAGVAEPSELVVASNVVVASSAVVDTMVVVVSAG